MSIEKNINSRIVHKHDIEANWIKATNFIPKQGEIIIYDIDDNCPYARFKIGDGLTLVNDLPFTIIQSDQNQNNETALDFIKNRLAYTIPGEYEIISDEIVPFGNGEVNGQLLYYTELTPLQGNWIDYNMSANIPMQLTINDRVINFITKTDSRISNCIYGGNLKLTWVDDLDTGEDFVIQAGLDTPQDTTGFCALLLKDLEPADSYHVSLKVVIKPDTYKKLDPIYYDRLGWTEDPIYNTGINVTTIPSEVEPDLYSFEIPGIENNFFFAGNYYSIKINDIEYIGYCYSDNFLGNPFLISPEGVYTDDPIALMCVSLNDGGYSLVGYYLTGIFPFTDSIIVCIQKYTPGKVKTIESQYYNDLGHFTTLWEKPPCTFIGTQSMEQENRTVYSGLNLFSIDDKMMSNLDTNLPVYINFDGNDYKYPFDLFTLTFGNLSLVDPTMPDTKEPFVIAMDDGVMSIAVLDQEPHTISFGQKIPTKIHEDLINVPLATSNIIGGVIPEVRTDADIQPVTIDEDGKLWTEPTSNTVVRDDGEGNVRLVSLATQNHENIVTDDNIGNVEIHSTSIYNPFPGVENATVGQIVQVAEIDEFGNPTKWKMIDAGNLNNNDIFIVNLDSSTQTASASATEIIQQAQNGKLIIGNYYGILFNIIPDSETIALGNCIFFIGENQAVSLMIQIDDNRNIIAGEEQEIDFGAFIDNTTYSYDKTTLINELNSKITRPSQATIGQVLTVKTVNSSNVPTAWETTTIPTALSDFTSDTTHRTVTDNEKTTWNNKANAYHSHGPGDFTFTGYKYDGLDPIAMNWIGSASSNKTFGLPQDAIQIEYSTDGGTTWIISDEDGRSLFNESRAKPFYLGNANTSDLNSLDCMMRITITPIDRYVLLRGVYHWMSTSGNIVTFDLERSTIGNPDTFVAVLTDQRISGWSGNNIHYFAPATFGGGESQLTNSYKYRLTYKMTEINSAYNAACIMDIRFFGENVWDTRSTSKMIRNKVQYNTPYSLDTINNKTIFPNAIQATSIIMPDTVTGTLYELSIANGELQINAI